MFRLSYRNLAYFFQQLAVMLEAGVPLRRAFATMQKTSRGRLRRLVGRMAPRLDQGESLFTIMAGEGSAFPPLALNLVKAGEAAGGLDTLLAALGGFYEETRQLRRQVMSNLAPSILQYALAVAVLAGAAWLRGTLGAGGGGADFWSGAGGILLVGWGGPIVALAGFMLLGRLVGGARAIHEILLRLPPVSMLMRALALNRFCSVMALCYGSSLAVVEAAAYSLDGTGNAAFSARKPRVLEHLRQGGRISEALAATRLFPVDLIEIVEVGEETGKLDENLRRRAEQYMEDARLAAKALTVALEWLVWIAVAGFIIMNIFAMVQGYMGALSGAGL
ncbi:MAG TPA: type II secretion system F family protein [Candidatus Brocadiia bacterium]|nr:type II secretion system F family protein [Candidatus Brocadiia bacterium]